MYIECKNLSLGYGGNTIVKDVNFSVSKGDYLCILGENGSGKSTLMKTILGLIKPLGGEIIFSDGLQRKDIGYLPQQTVVQKDFPASVKEIVLSGFQGSCGLRPFYNKEEKKRASENMEKLGITHLANRCYRELSGGQQQRVLLARALCAADKIILLDEPVSGLDPIAMNEMYSIIHKLNTEYGITVIMISHDIAAAMKYSTHILHVGSELFYGTILEYSKSHHGRKFFEPEE